MRRAPSLLALLALLLMPLGRARAEDAATAPPPVRVWVDADGFYRVKASALRALGYSDDQHVVAMQRGAHVFVHTSRVGDDPIFLVVSAFRRAAGRGSVVLRVADAPKSATAPPPPDDARAASRVGPRLGRYVYEPRVFGDLPAAELEVYAPPSVARSSDLPTWFTHRLNRGGTVEIPADSTSLPGSAQQLRMVLRLTQPGQARIQATHAGADLGTQEAKPIEHGGQTIEWLLPAVDPTKPVVLRNVTPAVPAPDRDVSDDRGTIWIESVIWQGPVRALPERGVVAWNIEPDEPEAILRPAHPGQRILAVAQGGAPIRMQPAADGSYVRASPPRSPLVFLSSELRDVTPFAAAPPRAVHSDAKDAEHVIVATQACLAGAKRLADHRTKTGLRSVAVAATDIYEVFADGEQDPQAIRAFLRKLREDSQGKTPKYVLLCGDAVRDRADKTDFETIPALMARTQYNGATPADSLYVEADDSHGVGAPFVGRLPFRDAATMEVFVDRLIAYETHPPVDRTRRLIRFLANEARFGPQVDAQIELFFRLIVTKAIPPEYDVEVTFASPTSTFLWPPREFNEKVIASLNEGALFYTYVGHGFDQGFDSLHVGNERYPVLHLKDVPRVNVTGTPPVMFSIACTTAQFDHPDRVGLGEALLAQPRGPIAFLGATRLCHPAGNVFLGRALAYSMFKDQAPGRRLGDVLANARDMVLDPSRDTSGEVNLLTLAARPMLPAGTGVTLERLQREAFWLDNLLGDPGTRLPFPEPLTDFTARWDVGAVEAEAGGLPEGTHVLFTVEMPRARNNPVRPLQKGLKAGKLEDAAGIRGNHRNANDKVVASAQVAARNGRARVRLALAADSLALTDPVFRPTLIVKAWVEAGERVLLGARAVTIPAPADPARPPDEAPR